MNRYQWEASLFIDAETEQGAWHEIMDLLFAIHKDPDGARIHLESNTPSVEEIEDE